MKWLRQWGEAAAGRKAVRVTVLWTDAGVSLVRWGGAPPERPVAERVVALEAGRCGAEPYAAALGSLLGAAAGRALVEWILLLESFPAIGQAAVAGGPGGITRGAADWMEACWRGLPPGLLPGRIYSATECLDAALARWTDYSRPGTAVCLPVDGRLLVAGHAEAGRFHRLARREPDGGIAESGPDPEWLQQTRMLYRSRTGHELVRLLLPACATPPPVGVVAGDIDLICRKTPPGWPHQPPVELPAATLFLHACGLRRAAARGGELTLPLVAERKRAQRRLQALRSGSLVLLAGWGLLLLGACGSGGQPAAPDAGALRWQQETRRWEGLRGAWQARQERAAAAERPYRIVGAVAGSIPEQVRLERIRIAPKQAGGDGALLVEMEGDFTGEGATPVFRKWLAILTEDCPVTRVESLQFESGGDSIRFFLRATSAAEGDL